jgi:nitrogen regulatory protein PII
MVTIISESVVEHKLIDDIKKCGAKGYSVSSVRGEGTTGNRSLDLSGPSIRLETVVTDKVAEKILDMLAENYFDIRNSCVDYSGACCPSRSLLVQPQFVP